jgi:hypothetical protein
MALGAEPAEFSIELVDTSVELGVLLFEFLPFPADYGGTLLDGIDTALIHSCQLLDRERFRRPVTASPNVCPSSRRGCDIEPVNERPPHPTHRITRSDSTSIRSEGVRTWGATGVSRRPASVPGLGVLAGEITNVHRVAHAMASYGET